MRGAFTEFDVVKFIFTSNFTFDGLTTSFFGVLLDFVNTNLAQKNSPHKKLNKIYNPVSEDVFWRFLACYMMINLSCAGKV